MLTKVRDRIRVECSWEVARCTDRETTGPSSEIEESELFECWMEFRTLCSEICNSLLIITFTSVPNQFRK